MPNALATLVVFKLSREATERERIETAARVAAFIRENFSAETVEEVITQLGVLHHSVQP